MVQNEPADLEHNIAGLLCLQQCKPKERQPQHYKPFPHSEESVPEAKMGWVLAKARSASSQFSGKGKRLSDKEV